jgi:class 3 adenylate cyclase/predicted ATPase/ribosomal protein L40E
VLCAKCNHDNPPDALFCMKCGAKVEIGCSSCGAVNPADANFCRKCGKALGAGAAASPASATKATNTPRVEVTPERQTAEGLDGERKTVTALFADIKGSMELIEDLDPEEARRLVDPALKLMIDAVHRYEGYVAQSTGDGIFALFGAPVAHEDHPQRALLASLKMQEDIKRYASKLREEGRAPIEIRVGVNTGEMVVRSIQTGELRAEYTPIGHSTSLAARMQALAPTGSIAVSEHTQKLVEGYFAFKALGPTRVKGVSEPVNIYELIGLGPLRTRLQMSAWRGLSRFVGRNREIEEMKRALERSKGARGQVVAAMGEAGLGKSRLFFEFKAVAQNSCLVLEAFSVSHGKASAYLPIIELLKDYFDLIPEDDERRRREKIGGKVLMLDRTLEDTLPYVFALLGVEEPGGMLGQIAADLRRRRTLDAIKRILLRESLNQPLIVIFEDLHWIDEQTQALLNLFVESIGTAKILMLVNYRPEYSHSWGSKTYYTQLRLDPLGRESAEELLSALMSDAVELQPLKRLIIEKTEGNPFFIEEIVRALFDQGVLVRNGAIKVTRSMSEIHIPPTVQGILTSRIDRLPADEKGLLQTLAVIGKEFPLGLVRGVTRKPDEELERMLAALQLSEFIYEQPAFPESSYTFKHALTQEVAYGSLLMERRKSLHEGTARQIEGLFNSRLEDHYGDLAHHYSCSGSSLKALEYLQLAAQQAIERSANTEAINHLTAAVHLLNTLPDTPQRDREELALQMMLGPVLIATKGNAALEVGVVYKRALQLGRKSGEDARLFPVLFGLRSFHLIRGELQPAFELAQQLVSLAESVQDSGLLVEAHLAQGNSLFLFGKLIPALEHMERGISLYDPQTHHVHAFLYGLDPGVFCLARTAWLLELLGHSDQASKRMAEALALAHRQSHAFSLAVALLHALSVFDLRREWPALQQQAEAAIAVCREQGFASILAQATMWRGYALAQQGQTEEGIALMRGGLDAQLATGASLFRPLFLCFLAEACGTAGRFEEGLAAVAEAIAIMGKTDERYYEAELHRLNGDLVLRRSGVEAEPSVQTEAEECFRKSIEIARQQEARSFELRAVTSLSRLWKQQGKKEQARQMLAEIYGWFSEGFDTKDLKEAKALIEQLS